MNNYRETYEKDYAYGYFKEIKAGIAISLDSGEWLIHKYGKYAPDMTFVVDEDHVNLGWTEMSVEEKKALNVLWDGSPDYMIGDFWVSKKGTKCFRPKADGKHLLIRNSWGGCFDDSRGREEDQLKDAAIYKRRAASNGGGSGNTYYVLPVNWRKKVSIDDI